MKTTMKIQMMMLTPVACAFLLAATGCSNKEEAVTNQPVPTQAAGDAAADTAQKAAATTQRQTEVVKEKAGEAAADLQAKVDAAAAKANDGNGKVQNLIEQAKKLVGENKWTEALAILNTLASQQAAGQSLSAGQQKVVDGLKEQIQKALAAKTANDAAGNLLKK
jgi:hypothetical protein